MIPYKFSDGALVDYRESFEWYFGQSPESAQRFEAAVEEALAALSSDPKRFARVDRRHRRSPVNGFPFAVIYRADRDCIYIVAIAHGSRNERYWRGR
jgi:plasmid stabilization system protein ParE